jgi:methionyl-tRNA synthetase
MGRDAFYITTPIYYANDVPHIGHGYNAVATDFIARYHRLRGEEVFHLTGTDEHGLNVKRKAEAHGMSPKEWTDFLEPKWREVWARLDIAYDDYIRTTEPRHYEAVAKLLNAVHENGRDDIYLDHYEGLYCVSCEGYYTEDDLLDGELCPVHERPVELFRDENYFFRLSAYRERLLEHYEANPQAVQPDTRRNEVVSLIKGGLQDFSISRTTFDWGVPIPWDPKHVTYVWFDALTNYITAAGYANDSDRFARLWPANIHSIGKDILRFHAVYWPAMLMAAGVEPPAQVWAHGFLTVGGKKMSKTNATGIHPFELIDHFGTDSYRYYFMREMRFGEDGSFSWESMIERHNADLANGLGNLAARVLAMLAREPKRTCLPWWAKPWLLTTAICSRLSFSPRWARSGTSSGGRTATWSRRPLGTWRRRRGEAPNSPGSSTRPQRFFGSWPCSSSPSCPRQPRGSGRSSASGSPCRNSGFPNRSPGGGSNPAPAPRRGSRSSHAWTPDRTRPLQWRVRVRRIMFHVKLPLCTGRRDPLSSAADESLEP